MTDQAQGLRDIMSGGESFAFYCWKLGREIPEDELPTSVLASLAPLIVKGVGDEN